MKYCKFCDKPIKNIHKMIISGGEVGNVDKTGDFFHEECYRPYLVRGGDALLKKEMEWWNRSGTVWVDYMKKKGQI